VRDRIAHLTAYFTAHGNVDPAAAHHQALVVLGKVIRRQSLILGFSDTFAVLGVVLVFAAALVILAKKGRASSVGASRSLCQ
jgi:DHA2 family multidrug resistance protein